MSGETMRQVMADACGAAVRNRRYCGNVMCLWGLIAARLRYAALCHSTHDDELMTAARRLEADAKALHGR
ncbi:MAG: hypothetical protein H7841_02570 [Magnetospirillum sp. WYHS-4]